MGRVEAPRLVMRSFLAQDTGHRYTQSRLLIPIQERL